MSLRTAEWDFFIAHASPDSAAAAELHDALEREHGARCFSDVRSLRPGDQWPVKLKEALSHSDITVVLVSSASEGAYYLHEEVALAIALARQSAQAHRIVAVLLRGARPEDLPYGLLGVHRIEEGEAGMQGVSDKLAALLAEPVSRPSPEDLVHLTKLLDDVWSRLGPAYEDEASRDAKQFRVRYAIEHGDIVARSHGDEQQRITRKQFEEKLTPDQLRHILVLERSMETNVALWERAYPGRTLDPENRAEADRALEAMYEDLGGVLDTLEESGFWLDDHYLDVRRLLRTHGSRRTPG